MMAGSSSLFAAVDWVVVAAYFALVFGVAAWATRRERAGRGTSADYFLAGRDAGWFVVGGSLLRAVLYTDLLQMFVLIAGALTVTVLGLQAVGGWDAMTVAVGGEAMSI